MFKSYLTIAWRNLWKNKTYSAINIFGLMTGITSCLLIGLFIQHELSFDKFQEKGDRIVRVIMKYAFSNGETEEGTFTSTKVAPTFVRTFPELEAGVRFSEDVELVRLGDKRFNENNFLYADSSFFTVFTYKLLQGDAKTALSGRYKVLLTPEMAQKYFGQTDPVGKQLLIGSEGTPYEVTGIIEKMPANSQISFDFLASFSSMGVNQENTYWEANYRTYLLLKEGQSLAGLQAKINTFIKQETKDDHATINFRMEPFNRIHLHSPFSAMVPNTSIQYIYIIGAIAFLVLSIACFTYINMSTARSMERAREVGVRKVMGAGKGQVFWQFVGESVVICFIALLLSGGLIALLLPAFNQLTGVALQLSSLFTPGIFITILFIIACIGLLAGSYPAMVLSAFQPVKVLKGSFRNTSSGVWLRKTLIVFQFVISIFMIIATVIVQQQLHHIRNKEVGYNRDQVLILPLDDEMSKHLAAIKVEFKSNPAVQSVSRAVSPPNRIYSGYSMRSAAMAPKDEMSVNAGLIDEDYVQTVGLQLVAGQDLTLQDRLDVEAAPDGKEYYHYLLNESGARALGWTPEQAIGQKMFMDDGWPGEVKGVVKDFHFQSLHIPIKPLVLAPGVWGRVLLVKLSGQSVPSTIAFLEKKWRTLVPHRPFEYHFLDEDYNNMYASERRLGHITNLFAGIAILLAGIGLLGLSSYAAHQRTREIGIRKVLGASLPGILLLLSKDFLRLILLSFVIAAPLAWYATHQWLQEYAYRVSIHWWVFGAVGLGALLIALLTVSSQSLKAALMNPAKSLHNE
ncbi:MAG: ABC transporter permease [Candidatus Pseudobacter hemicellulosilyticus]|uniref:ABC transporter permease n=1 Tax=Candidatus Pseudobacter hemicellulosilyticus TaxID=3121375 RepID=A0AAJ5WZD6_9BACT|nr:MAG: ABC transporter permease [Pseudobacter sp.]